MSYRRRATGLQKRYGRKKKVLTVFEKHQLKIARQDYNMPDGMRGVMGAMSRAEARRVIRELTGRDPGP